MAFLPGPDQGADVRNISGGTSVIFRRLSFGGHTKHRSDEEGHHFVNWVPYHVSLLDLLMTIEAGLWREGTVDPHVSLNTARMGEFSPDRGIGSAAGISVTQNL